MTKQQREQISSAIKAGYVAAKVRTAEKIILKAAENALKSKSKIMSKGKNK